MTANPDPVRANAEGDSHDPEERAQKKASRFESVLKVVAGMLTVLTASLVLGNTLANCTGSDSDKQALRNHESSTIKGLEDDPPAVDCARFDQTVRTVVGVTRGFARCQAMSILLAKSLRLGSVERPCQDALALQILVECEHRLDDAVRPSEAIAEPSPPGEPAPQPVPVAEPQVAEITEPVAPVANPAHANEPESSCYGGDIHNDLAIIRPPDVEAGDPASRALGPTELPLRFDATHACEVDAQDAPSFLPLAPIDSSDETATDESGFHGWLFDGDPTLNDAVERVVSFYACDENVRHCDLSTAALAPLETIELDSPYQRLLVQLDGTTVWVPADYEPPSIRIDPDSVNFPITEPTNVTGVVADTDLEEWTLSYRALGGDETVTIATGWSPGADGILGRLDPSELDTGVYELWLTATDLLGHTSEHVTLIKGLSRIEDLTFEVRPALAFERPVFEVALRVPESAKRINPESTHFEYDVLGRVVRATRASHPDLEYGYDAVGNLTLEPLEALDGTLSVAYASSFDLSSAINLTYGEEPPRRRHRLLELSSEERFGSMNYVTQFRSNDTMLGAFSGVMPYVGSNLETEPSAIRIDPWLASFDQTQELDESTTEARRSSRRTVIALGLDYLSSPTVRPLEFAAEDADRVAGAFGVLGYETLVLGDNEASVRSLLLRLREQATDSRPGDSLVLFFSGHGVSNASGQVGLLMPGADSPEILPLTVLESALADYQGDVVFIADGCSTELSWLPDFGKGPSTRRGKLAVLLATQVGHAAIESPSLGSGLFTHNLLGYLQTLQVDSELESPADLREIDLVRLFRTVAQDTARVSQFTYGLDQRPLLALPSNPKRAVPFHPLQLPDRTPAWAVRGW